MNATGDILIAEDVFGGGQVVVGIVDFVGCDVVVVDGDVRLGGVVCEGWYHVGGDGDVVDANVVLVVGDAAAVHVISCDIV